MRSAPRPESGSAGGAPEPQRLGALEHDCGRDRLGAAVEEVEAAEPAPRELTRHGADEARGAGVLDQRRGATRLRRSRVEHQEGLDRVADLAGGAGLREPQLRVARRPFVRHERGGGRNAVPRRQALEVPAARGGGRPQALGQRPFDRERRRGKARAALSARGAERQDGRDDGGRALGIEERGSNRKARRPPQPHLAGRERDARHRHRKKPPQQPRRRGGLPDQNEADLAPVGEMLQGGQQNVRIGKQRRLDRPLGKGAPSGEIGADLVGRAELDLVAAAGLGPGRPQAARGRAGRHRAGPEKRCRARFHGPKPFQSCRNGTKGPVRLLMRVQDSKTIPAFRAG